MSENNGSQVSSTIAIFAVGALAGAGLALLFAPRSGRETRDLLAQTGRDVKDSAEQVLSDAKTLLNHKKTEVVAAVEAAKSAMREERSRQSMPG